VNPRQLLSISPVMPVVVLERLADAVPLARSLWAGGIGVLEVTLRTPVALAAVRAIRDAIPEICVGVGTVTTADELAQAIDAGAGFAVSPGATSQLLEAARASALPFVPGVMSASEVMAARDAGFDTLKLFPARAAGGVALLKALAGPFPDVMFCPTGGIDLDSAPAYLALSNVGCVGGSWLAPAAALASGDWPAIEALARGARGLRAAPPGATR